MKKEGFESDWKEEPPAVCLEPLRFQKEDREERQCKNCEFFHRHYICQDDGEFIPLLYGYCTKPRLKKKYVNSGACVNWRKQERR